MPCFHSADRISRFIPLDSRCSWSRRSCRMPALHGAGSDSTATIWEARWRLVGRSAATCPANWYTSVCRISRQAAGNDLSRTGAGNGHVLLVDLVPLLTSLIRMKRSGRGILINARPQLSAPAARNSPCTTNNSDLIEFADGDTTLGSH